MNIRLKILVIMCKFLLPKDLFIGKHFGGYTQKYDIIFGKLDERGVLQGYDVKQEVLNKNTKTKDKHDTVQKENKTILYGFNSSTGNRTI